MTAKIKLNAASGGGSFSLQAPSSSSNNRVFTIPDVADGTIATTATAGKVINSSEALKKDTFSTQSTSFTDITGLSVTMTPASTSSKFLVTYNVIFSPRDQHYSGGIRCVKVVGGTTTDDIYVGNASGNRIRCSNFAFSDNGAPSYDAMQTQSGSFLHSPNTTSAVTFKMQCTLFGPYGWANDVFVNRTNTYQDTTYFGSPVSAITVLELSS